jgi:hypothetical protein
MKTALPRMPTVPFTKSGHSDVRRRAQTEEDGASTRPCLCTDQGGPNLLVAKGLTGARTLVAADTLLGSTVGGLLLHTPNF